jgi:hypothetical protein
VRCGPLRAAEAVRQRIGRLPAFADEPRPVEVNRRGDGGRGAPTALGMCGVLRPLVSLEQLR